MILLNDITRNSLAGLFPNQVFTFTNKTTTWDESSRIPTEIEETIELTGRMQPLDPQLLDKLGFNIMDYQYFRVYISNITPTQSDKVRQLGTSKFTYDLQNYQIVGKLPWDTNNWRELYCYLIEE